MKHSSVLHKSCLIEPKAEATISTTSTSKRKIFLIVHTMKFHENDNKIAALINDVFYSNTNIFYSKLTQVKKENMPI